MNGWLTLQQLFFLIMNEVFLFFFLAERGTQIRKEKKKRNKEREMVSARRLRLSRCVPPIVLISVPFCVCSRSSPPTLGSHLSLLDSVHSL